MNFNKAKHNQIIPQKTAMSSFVAKPSRPALLEVVNITEDSVTLSWLSPERDGGSRIVRYVVEMHDMSQPLSDWTRVKVVGSSDILVACIEHLKEKRKYQFRVYAENKVGVGPATQLRESVIPRSLLGTTFVIWQTCRN